MLKYFSVGASEYRQLNPYMGHIQNQFVDYCGPMLTLINLIIPFESKRILERLRFSADALVIAKREPVVRSTCHWTNSLFTVDGPTPST